MTLRLCTLLLLDNLPTPYLFDVTHYESLRHNDLKAHIDRIGVVIYQQEIIESGAIGS